MTMSGLNTLTSAARLVQELEDRGEVLRKRAVSVHSLLEAVWPDEETAPSFPADVSASILANEYYLKSLPLFNYSDEFKTNVLFLAESAAVTPALALGKPFTVESITDDVLREELGGLLQKHHLGHVNLVHCPTYGELPFIDLEGEDLSEGEQKSIDGGTPQFWRVLLAISGYYDQFASGKAENDPLRNQTLYKESADFVIGTAAGRNPNTRAQRIKNRIRVMDEMQARGNVLADVCPVPLYAGVGSSFKCYSKKNKRWYTDRKIKFKASSKRKILQVSWREYGEELVEYYRPRKLVILGKSIHDAIGKEAHLLVESFGGEYVGYVNHPSWNQFYGHKIMPLLCDLRKMASTDMDETNVTHKLASMDDTNAATRMDKENVVRRMASVDDTMVPRQGDDANVARPTRTDYMDMLPDLSSSDSNNEDMEIESDWKEDAVTSDAYDRENENVANYDFSGLDLSSYDQDGITHQEQPWMYSRDEEPDSNMSFSIDFEGVDTSTVQVNAAVIDWLAAEGQSLPSKKNL